MAVLDSTILAAVEAGDPPPDTYFRDSRMRDSVVRAIVHLNFSEPEQALDVLLDALTDFNFGKEVIYGHTAA